MPATYTNASTTLTPVGVAKTRFFLGTTTTTPDNDTFIEIANVIQFPELGASATPVKTATIPLGSEVTTKGVQTFGGGDMMVVTSIGDTGQTNLLTAAQDYTGKNYNIRVVLPNVATSTGTGTMYDIKAQILSAQPVVGTANDVHKQKVTLAFNSEKTITAAT